MSRQDTAPAVLLESRIGRVAILTLHRPERLNALDRALIVALEEAVHRVAADDQVGCVVLTGSGRGFCSGGDLTTKKISGAESDPAAPVLRGSFEARMRELRASMNAGLWLHEMDKPTIAMINGPCAGAGMSLASACDLRFAAQSAAFKSAFNEVGLTGDYGGAWFWTKILGSARARELYLLGDKLDAGEALRIGIVSRVYADAELYDKTIAIATRLAENKPWSARLTKQSLNAAETGGLREVLDREALNQTLASQALGLSIKRLP
jgi:2-(1,2-epoxy-1,2-dihydrophenyl)acetyl-CoA isomerase